MFKGILGVGFYFCLGEVHSTGAHGLFVDEAGTSIAFSFPWKDDAVFENISQCSKKKTSTLFESAAFAEKEPR